MTDLVGVTAAGDAGLEFEEVKFSTDFERKLLADFGESQGAAIITTYWQFDQLAGSRHCFWPTRALRYSP